VKNRLFYCSESFIYQIMNRQKAKFNRWVMVPFIMLILAACEKVVFEPVEIPNEDVSYATDIQPILDGACVSCHPPTKSLDLTAAFSYDALVPEFAAPADSANPEGSKLYLKLTGTSHGPKTSEVEKQTILKWIDQGVPNN
jgi:hypothetical protein